VFIVGHGRSEGEPVYIDDIQVYIRDVRQHITEVTADYPDIPLFIVGYSMVSAMRFLRPPKHLNDIYTFRDKNKKITFTKQILHVLALTNCGCDGIFSILSIGAGRFWGLGPRIIMEG